MQLQELGSLHHMVHNVEHGNHHMAHRVEHGNHHMALPLLQELGFFNDAARDVGEFASLQNLGFFSNIGHDITHAAGTEAAFALQNLGYVGGYTHTNQMGYTGL